MLKPHHLILPTLTLAAASAAVHAQTTQTQPTQAQPAQQQPHTVEIKMSEWDIGLKNLTVPAGMVRFNVVNDGQFPHSFAIRGKIDGKDIEVQTPVLQKGEKSVMLVNLPAGTYNAYCPVGQHEARGMTSTITFEAPKASQ